MELELESLVAAARAAQEKAYAPYSGYRVGCALLGGDGRIFSGCNVENRSFGLSLCAERVAVASAIVAGCRDYRMLVVLTPSEPPGTPCGLCRETLIEFGPPDLPIVLIGANGTRRDHVLSDLLPEPFQFEPTQ